MSPTSYQAAPPRVRKAHLIERQRRRQAIGVESSASLLVMPSPLPSPGGRGGGRGRDGRRLLGGKGTLGVEEDDVFGVDEVELLSGGFFGGELAAVGGGNGGTEAR